MKNVSSKNKTQQSPESTKKYSSKYNSSKHNGYRHAINIAQNFGHVHNKNFNLYIRQIYFTDKNCVQKYNMSKNIRWPEMNYRICRLDSYN